MADPLMTMKDGLTRACERYCSWYAHGNSAQAGEIAYDLVSSIRQALAEVDALVQAVIDLHAERDADTARIGYDEDVASWQAAVAQSREQRRA